MKSNLKQIEVTIQDIWNASRPTIQRNKKKYTRKDKHRSKMFGN